MVYLKILTTVLILFQNIKGKADNRARILAWLNQLDNQVKMADEKNILPSEVVNAGVGQLSEWAKDSPAVDDANAHHAYNKIKEVSKAVSEGLSKAERDQVCYETGLHNVFFFSCLSW